MDVDQNHTGNDTPINSYHRMRTPNQGWHLDYVDGKTVTFRGVQSNKCLDIYQSGSTPPPESGRGLVIFDCRYARLPNASVLTGVKLE